MSSRVGQDAIRQLLELGCDGGHLCLKSGSEDITCVTSMPSQKRIGQCRVSSSKAFCPVQQASKRLKISRMDMSTQMRDPPFVPRSIVRTSCISSFRRYSSMSINSVVVAYTTAWYQPCTTQACTGKCWKGNGNTQCVRFRPIGQRMRPFL